MTRIAILLLLAGVAAPSLGQVATLRNLASVDGGVTWSSNVNAAPGSTVFVQVQVTLSGASPLGLAGFDMQPTLSSWNSANGDTRLPFTFPGLQYTGEPQFDPSSYDGYAVADVPGSTGRMFPYGSAGQGISSASGILTSFNDPGNTLRFAGSKNTTPELNTAWGVVVAQVQPNLAGTTFSSTRNPVVFRYAVTLGSSDLSPRTLVADVPLSTIPGGRVGWWLNAQGTNVLYLNFSQSSQATINVVPSTSSVALIVLGCSTMGHQRRRRP